jgi:hypothetical protein
MRVCRSDKPISDGLSRLLLSYDAGDFCNVPAVKLCEHQLTRR